MCEDLKEYPLFLLCSRMRSGSRKIIKRRELSGSPCMAPLCIGIGCVLLKYSSMNLVVYCE